MPRKITSKSDASFEASFSPSDWELWPWRVEIPSDWGGRTEKFVRGTQAAMRAAECPGAKIRYLGKARGY